MPVASWNSSLLLLLLASPITLAASQLMEHPHLSCLTCHTTPTLTQALLASLVTWLKRWVFQLIINASFPVTHHLMAPVLHTQHQRAWTLNHKHILSSLSNGHDNQARLILEALSYLLEVSYPCPNTMVWEVQEPHLIKYPKTRA